MHFWIDWVQGQSVEMLGHWWKSTGLSFWRMRHIVYSVFLHLLQCFSHLCRRFPMLKFPSYLTWAESTTESRCQWMLLKEIAVWNRVDIHKCILCVVSLHYPASKQTRRHWASFINIFFNFKFVIGNQTLSELSNMYIFSFFSYPRVYVDKSQSIVNKKRVHITYDKHKT